MSRSIEEIKEDMAKVKEYLPAGMTNTDLCELEYELRNALIFGIPLDRLEEMCRAERDKVCEYCKPHLKEDVGEFHDFTLSLMRFCPMCGRKLREDEK